MPQTKATKKFEKQHLKDTLERRKGLKKSKQKQQLKRKKKARKAEEEGGDVRETEDAKRRADGKKASGEALFQDMTVDDFFQRGFEIPEAPQLTRVRKRPDGKRKRQERDEEESGEEDAASSDASGDQARVSVEDYSDASSDADAEDLKAQLDALVDNDPEFHKYLQDDEPELLQGKLVFPDNLSEDDGGPKRKKRKPSPSAGDDSEHEMLQAGENELILPTINKWRAAMAEQHSLRATRQVILAFRSAAHIAEEDGKSSKYSISDPHAYHQLLTIALQHVPEVLQHHLPVQESSKSGKVHVATEAKFQTFSPMLKSHVSSILHLLDQLSDAQTLRLTLTSTLPLLPYLLSFKKLLRDLIKSVSAVWSTPSSTEATRIAAFLVLRRLQIISDQGIRETVLKQTYESLIRSAGSTTVHSLAGINLMKNSAAELWVVDTGVGYTTAFTFIRQLAIHLRASLTNNANESYKAVYNWQFTHGLDFWSRVLAAYASSADSPLRPLVYPLVQVTLGAIRLIPTATYFPLRFQLVRALLRVSLATGTYIPLASHLTEVLNSAEMRKAPKPATLKPLEFETSLRAPKSYLRTRTYQDGVGEQVQELLSEFFVLWAKSIAFPELALPVVVVLKRWLKDVQSRASGAGNKNQKLNTAISLLVQKLKANASWIEERRGKVQFAPNNRKGVEEFLGDVEWTKTPLGAYVVGQRKARAEKARLVEEGRREEDSKREKERERGRARGRVGEGEDRSDEEALSE